MLCVVVSHNSDAPIRNEKLDKSGSAQVGMAASADAGERVRQVSFLFLRWVMRCYDTAIAYSPPTLSYQTEDTLKLTLSFGRHYLCNYGTCPLCPSLASLEEHNHYSSLTSLRLHASHIVTWPICCNTSQEPTPQAERWVITPRRPIVSRSALSVLLTQAHGTLTH